MLSPNLKRTVDKSDIVVYNIIILWADLPLSMRRKDGIHMKNNNTYKLVLAGLFAALCCISTFIHIPTFFTMGYVNLGDCFVIASGLLLGPVWGAAAGGIGSMLTDLILGYATYAPGTLIIKAAMAVVASLIYSKCSFGENKILSKVIAAIYGEIVMVGGYFVYEYFILAYGYAAVSSIAGNLLQAAAGIIAAIPVTTIIERSKLIKK